MVSFGIEGILAPVFTPFTDDGDVNYDVIPEYMQHLVANGVRGILVGGTTGEAVCLNVGERQKVLNAWLKEARPLGVKVIFQVGGVPLPDVITLAKFAESSEADAIMTLPELYYKPRSVEQLVSYLEVVSQAAPSLPLIYYHFPMMTGVDVNMAEFFLLASSRIPNFKGMKADLGVALQIADRLGEDQKFFIANHLLAPSALLGYDSSIATVTNMFPGLVQDLVDSVKEGQVEKTRDLQKKLNKLVADISSQGDFVPTMKVAMELITGVKVGPPRLPLSPLDDLRRSRIRDSLMSNGIRLAD